MTLDRPSISKLRRIIAGAQAAGELDRLYWYLALYANGKTGPASYPWGCVPVVPVASDPHASGQEAHMMLELAREFTPGAVLYTDLTDYDTLQASLRGVWYRFGDIPPLDVVCAVCGAVGVHNEPCGVCADPPKGRNDEP